MLIISIEMEDKEFEMIFHPNVCHVCKSRRNLIPCSRCHLISYCSKEHLRKHQKEHAEFCDTILNFVRTRNIWNTRVMTQRQWNNFMKENVQYLELYINRTLELSEKRLLLCAKSCQICHRQQDLTACKTCGSVYVCPNHEIIQHNCPKLLHSVDLDHNYINHMDRTEGVPQIYKRFEQDDICDMPSFINSYVHMRTVREYRQKPNALIYSDIFSKPLTLIYGIIQAGLYEQLLERRNEQMSTIHVHIVLEEPLSQYYLTAWEILLHQICRNNVTVMLRVFGSQVWDPELQGTFYAPLLCNSCQRRDKKLICYVDSEFYYDYARASKTIFLKPDVIALFDVDLWNKTELLEDLKEFQRQNCPILITAKSEVKTIINVAMINKLFGPHINPLVDEENKFASLRPRRSNENCAVYYHNAYLAVYLNLNDAVERIIIGDNRDSNINKINETRERNDKKGNQNLVMTIAVVAIIAAVTFIKFKY